MLSLDKEFYTANEVADLLRVNVGMIYKAVKAGHLRAHRVGVRKGQRFSRDDINAYLAKLRGDA